MLYRYVSLGHSYLDALGEILIGRSTEKGKKKERKERARQEILTDERKKKSSER